jgi:hypothetical protein
MVMTAMRDKVEEILCKAKPRVRFQLIKLEGVEDWIAYAYNLQTMGFKTIGAWRLSWGDRLYYIIPMYFGPAESPEKIRIIVECQKSEKGLAEYFIQNVLRTFIRDKMLDELINDFLDNTLMRW